MKDLANKTFFRFLFGFIAIIATSFLVITMVGYYEGQNNTASVVEECQEGEDC